MSDVIMYVEDDKIAREAFATFFKRKKYEVHAFEKPEQAEEALKTLKPQIIVSDQKLGKNSLGWEFLKRSIALSSTSIRFILSGYSDSEMILHSYNEGIIFDYLSKSSRIEEIEIKIKNACAFWHTIHTKQDVQETRDDLLMRVSKLTKELKLVNDQLVMKTQEVEHLKQLLNRK